jgi:hypothetical protein
VRPFKVKATEERLTTNARLTLFVVTPRVLVLVGGRPSAKKGAATGFAGYR